MPLVKPSEALGVFTESLNPAFQNVEDVDKLIEAMKWEDTTLRKFVDKTRLDNWHRTIVEAAEKRCQTNLDEETVNGAKMAEPVEEQPQETNGRRTTRSQANGKSA